MSNSCTKLKFIAASALGKPSTSSLSRRPDALRAKPAWDRIQTTRRPLGRAGRGLDDPAVLPHRRPGGEVEAVGVMAGDEEVGAALLDEDEEDAIALVERVGARREHAQLDALDDAVAGDGD